MIGDNIKKYRNQKGLTQKQLAEKVGCATGTIQQYELGKRQPRIEQSQKIADALSIPLSYLFDVQIGYEENKTEYKKPLIEIISDFLRIGSPPETSLSLKFGNDTQDAAITGLISILEELYGKVEAKTVHDKDNKIIGVYFVIGLGISKFILSPENLLILYNVTSSNIKTLVDTLKDTRNENIIINEIRNKEQ